MCICGPGPSTNGNLYSPVQEGIQIFAVQEHDRCPFAGPDGMQSFWNSVEAVDVVARVFPMCCIRLSLLNIHQAIQPITVLFGS